MRFMAFATVVTPLAAPAQSQRSTKRPAETGQLVAKGHYFEIRLETSTHT